VRACGKEHGVAKIRLSEKEVPVLCLHCLPDKVKCVAVCQVNAVKDVSGVLVADAGLLHRVRCVRMMR
jgi:Fe-S-cluster-containing hydrogenase component 2